MRTVPQLLTDIRANIGVLKAARPPMLRTENVIERLATFADGFELAWKQAHDEAYATYKRMNDALEKCECVIMCATRFIQIPEWSSVRDCDWDGALRAIRKAREVKCAEPEGGQC